MRNILHVKVYCLFATYSNVLCLIAIPQKPPIRQCYIQVMLGMPLSDSLSTLPGIETSGYYVSIRVAEAMAREADEGRGGSITDPGTRPSLGLAEGPHDLLAKTAHGGHDLV